MKFSDATILKTEYMRTLGLTEDQRQQRTSGIGGSDAKDIWEGNWIKVYDRLVHQEQEDLSNIFKVQLGHVTEYFNIIWNAAEHGWELNFPQGSQTHPDFSYLRCLADAIGKDQTSEFVIDAKHTMAKAPWWDEQKVVETYYWQAQHNMLVYGMGRFALTPIWGNQVGEPLWIEATPDHQEAYLEKARAFWWHVENKTPPGSMEEGEKVEIIYDDMRKQDMKGNNNWAVLSKQYLETKDGHDAHLDAKKLLKESVAADVKDAFGYGVQIKRNKKGALTISAYEDKSNAA